MDRTRFHSLTAVLWAVTATSLGLSSATGAESCGQYGTEVVFAETPVAASKLALEQEKLVFVLHVSGNFEVSEYT